MNKRDVIAMFIGAVIGAAVGFLLPLRWVMVYALIGWFIALVLSKETG